MSENSPSFNKNKSIVANLVNSINLMTATSNVQRSSSRCSSPASSSSTSSSTSLSLNTKPELDTKLNENKRTLSSSSLASSMSSSSNLYLKTSNNQTSDYVEDSSIGGFDDSASSKCLNNLKLNQVCRSNRSSISTSTTNNLDDFNDDNNLLMVNYTNNINDDSAICNMSKLKIKKQENEFNNLISKCQNWIETVTNKKFAYPNDFRKSLENGVILCELLNVLKPDCIRRINRHSTPIAGIDNLNQFLKACQENFNLSQANLFDITDLEDLVKRRGTNSNNLASTNKLDNSNLNNHLIDEEQQRRLKKVVHTINWLSQKANKFGITLPYYFDSNNLNVQQPQQQQRQQAILKPISNKNKILTSYYSNTSLSQYSTSSTSSSLSSSSSFINSNTSAVSLSVIIGPGDSIKLSTPKSNCLLKQRVDKKEIACSSSSSYSDEISQSSSSQSRFECMDDCARKLEQKQDKMSYTYKTTSLKNEFKESVETIPFSSPSPSTSSSYSQNLNTDLISTQNKSQEDLRLIDANCSPISSTNSVSSPRYVQTQNLTNPSNTPTPNSNSNSSSAKIPTRNFDRRVSTSVMDTNPFKFNVNYSAAGQQFAKKAKEQLKTVEKSKELNKLDSEKKTSTTKKKNDYVNNDDESLNDDWQNRVDDWKKRRREKQKLPVKTRNFEEDEPVMTRSERKRINPFENSQYYIMPLNDEITQEKCAISVEITTKSPNEIKQDDLTSKKDTQNMSMNQSLDESQNELDESQNVQYVYIEKNVDIVRPDNYSSRGFGFLLNSGVKKDGENEPLSVLINNEIVLVNGCYAQIVVVEPETLADKAGLKKGDLVVEINDTCTNNLNNEQLRKIMRQRLQMNSIQMKVLSQQRQHDFEKTIRLEKSCHESEQDLPNVLTPSTSSGDSTPTTISSITTNPLLNNSTKQADYHQIVAPKPYKKSYHSNQSENMNTESLIEKRKTQLNLILNWTLSTNTEHKKLSDTVSDKQVSLSSPESSLSSLDDLARKNDQIASSSLSPNSEQIESLYDSLSNYKQKSKESDSDKVKIEKSSNDDTDHDNDDDDLLQSPRPPPIPTTEPPPLPSVYTKTSKTDHVENSPASLEIKKALLDNMKSIENWKQEQEILMKRKYEEEQKRIQESLKLDLDRVKEEEIQRREQERLKLEKEKIRLQELEIKQREEEIKKNLDENQNRLSSPIQLDSTSELKTESQTQETIRKEDLNALIQKIYTEETEEPDFLKLETPEPVKPQRPNPPPKITPLNPILINNKKLAASSVEQTPLSSLIDTNLKHEVIKHVHDTMDHLKNELLNKGMNKYADDVATMSKSLDLTRQKQEDMERIRLEQETIRQEKERIEKEKEKLRLEAEQLRKEREMILMTGSLISPPINEFIDYNVYKTNLQADIRPNNKSLSPTRKHINIVTKNQILPSNRFVEETPGYKTVQKINHLKNPSTHMNIIDQKMRRSVPNLIEPKNLMNTLSASALTRPKNPTQRVLISKPPQPYQQKISQSQKILNQPQIYQNSSQQIQTISLSQKCSTCNQILGQGSAMWIEKLGLAFHLKCFRCSVCNIALGNGKEGTDVRVSGANRLHCNNCFSNDLGLRLSAV